MVVSSFGDGHFQGHVINIAAALLWKKSFKIWKNARKSPVKGILKRSNVVTVSNVQARVYKNTLLLDSLGVYLELIFSGSQALKSYYIGAVFLDHGEQV